MAQYLKVGDKVYVAQDDLFDKSSVGKVGTIKEITAGKATVDIMGAAVPKSFVSPLSDLEKLEFHPELARR